MELKNNFILLAGSYEIQKKKVYVLVFRNNLGRGGRGLGFCWVALGLLIMTILYMVWVFQYILVFDTN